MDQWDGYVSDCEKILGILWDKGIDNIVIFIGDIYIFWVSEIQFDFGNFVEVLFVMEFVIFFVILFGFLEYLVDLVVVVVQVVNLYMKYVELKFLGFMLVDVMLV